MRRETGQGASSLANQLSDDDDGGNEGQADVKKVLRQGPNHRGFEGSAGGGADDGGRAK